MASKSFKGVCYVCLVLDKDPSEKDVRSCKVCGVNMCAPCWTSPKRRAKAFAKKLKTKIDEKLKKKLTGEK